MISNMHTIAIVMVVQKTTANKRRKMRSGRIDKTAAEFLLWTLQLKPNPLSLSHIILKSQHSNPKETRLSYQIFARKGTDHWIKNRQEAKRERRQENSNHEPLVSTKSDTTLMHIGSTGNQQKTRNQASL